MTPLIVTCEEMALAERAAIQSGIDSYALMQRAGEAVSGEITRRRPDGAIAVLCGPGNNGGDGFVVAEALRAAGRAVEVFELAGAPQSSDRSRARGAYRGAIRPLSEAHQSRTDILVDALFGAGLNRPLTGQVADLTRLAEPYVIAIDLPSGVNGDEGLVGPCFKADLTVSFSAHKPAHVLADSRDVCGHVVVVDIGVTANMIAQTGSRLAHNAPQIWAQHLPRPGPLTHKHQRGHLMCVTGRMSQTGAARLSARAGLRGGAGLVTLLSPPDAVLVNAMHATTVMVSAFRDPADLKAQAGNAACVVIRPAAGVGQGTRANVLAALETDTPCVLDADALTSFAHDRDNLFTALRPDDILTPHPGEFSRLFPEIAQAQINRIEKARRAARMAGCCVLLKGADTLIAQSDGQAIINTHASPWLATAGSGDVLAGLIGGWKAQGLDTFSAAAAATWLHGDLGQRGGPGTIAEDLIELIPQALSDLLGLTS